MKYRHAALVSLILVAACGSGNNADKYAQIWLTEICDSNTDLTIFEGVGIKSLKLILGEPQSVRTEHAANMAGRGIILPKEYLYPKEAGREFQIYEWEKNDCILTIATTQFATSEKSVTAAIYIPGLVFD